MARKCSQRVVCAQEVPLNEVPGFEWSRTPVAFWRTDFWRCEVITQDSRRRLRPITGIVGHRTPRSREAVRALAKAEGASLIIWTRRRL